MELSQPTLKQLERNIPKLYLFTFAHMFIVLLPVVVPFFESRGLSMREIYEIQAMFAFTVVVCEVPSGYLADIWGRKRIMTLGALLGSLGFSVMAFVESYNDFVLAEILLGLGFAMVSGADLSLLYDSARALGKADAGKLSNLTFFNSMGEAMAAVAGGWLAAIAFEAVVIGSAAAMAFCFLVGLTVVEVPREKKPQRHWDNIKSAWREIYHQGLWFRGLIANFFYCSLLTYVLVWLLQKYWAEQGIPLLYFGYLWALFNLTVAVSAKLTPWLERRLGARGCYLLVPVFYLIGLVGMGHGQGLIGVFLGLGLNLGRGLSTVILKEAINARLESEFRATINSLLSLGVRLGYCLLGPLIGYLADTRGITFVLDYAALTVVIAFGALMLPLLIKGTWRLRSA